MENKPLISIITITYNAEESVGVTLESVSQQTFRDYEHIIIDGASRDHTLALARVYAGVRILSEPDDGLYHAMNKGIDMARGKYLLFLNAGDTFHTRNTLSAYAERAICGDDIIYGDTVIVDSSRHIIGKRHLTAPRELTFKSFANGMLVCHQSFMVRKELAGHYNTDYRFSADYDWCVECIKKSNPKRCTNLAMIVTDYLRDGLTDKNRMASLKERFRIMSHHYGTIPTTLRHIKFLIRDLLRKI